MSHKKFGPDRFSRFDVYWIQTNKQTPKQTNRQAKFIYRSSAFSKLFFTVFFCSITHWAHNLKYDQTERNQITKFCSHIFWNKSNWTTQFSQCFNWFFFGYELQKKTVIFLTYKLKKFLLNDYHSQNFTIVRKIVLIYLILQSSNRSKFFNN